MTAQAVSSRAILADGAGQFTLETVTVDPPAAGEVRVAMAAAGVCHTDHASLYWPGPRIMGHEGAGRIEAVGAGVDGLQPGQPVLLNWAIPCGDCFQCRRGAQALCERSHDLDPSRLGSSGAHEGAARWQGRPVERSFHLGTFADHTVVRAEAVVPLPEGLPPEVACIMGCAVMTGVGSAINAAEVAAGESVVVLGCGGVGLNVIQGARIAGASTIVAIDPVTERLHRARALGATHAWAPEADDTGHEKLAERVRAVTGGRGADHAFEATGVPALAFVPLKLVRNGGRALQVSGAHGPATLELTDLFWNKQYLTPLYGNCVPSRDFPRWFEWVATGELEVASLISHHYPLDDLQTAFDDMLEGRSTKGVLHIA